MQINREFYDGSTYEFYAPNENNVLLAQIVNATMESKILADFDKYSGEWDKSVSPWKINHNSALFSNAWALSWYDGSVTNHKFSRLYKERKKGYTFYLATQGFENNADYDNYPTYTAMYAPQYLSTLTNPDINLENSTYTTAIHSKYGYIMPVINFNYSRLFVVPVIHYKSNNTDYSALLQSTTANNFNPTTISGFSFAFYYINSYGTVKEFPLGLYSLNNKIIPPYWSEWTTNCWKNEEIDNGFALLSYRVSRSERYTVTSDYANKLQVSGQEGTAYKDETIATESAAATLNYFPAKREPTFTNALPDRDPDIFDDNWTPYYIGGVSGWYNSIYRNCKSSVTFEEFVDYIKLQAAYLGFRFCPFYDKAREGVNSQYFYIPEINENGVTTGNYYAANSADAQNLPNYQWTDNVYSVTPYDGTDDEEDEDPNDYDVDNETILNSNAFNAPSARFQNYYIIPSNRVVPLIRYLYSDLPTNQPQTDYLTSNTIDCVVSFMSFPFVISPLIGTENIEVYFGKINSGLQTKGLIPALVQKIDCGECTYYSPFGADDFRSYEPYYTAEIYLPYCGNIKLNPSVFLNANNNTKIKVEYLVDLVTGACIAMVYRDNLVVEMATGQIGVNLPLTGVQSADLQRDITNKQAALKSARNTALASVARTIATASGATSNVSASSIAGVVSGVTSSLNAIESAKVANYAVEHVQVPYNVKGGASPLTDYAYEQIPRITFRRPVMLPTFDAEKYGHSVGYATLETDVIGNYSGYAEITGVDLSGISATDEEKALIKKYLESGVYL